MTVGLIGVLTSACGSGSGNGASGTGSSASAPRSPAEDVAPTDRNRAVAIETDALVYAGTSAATGGPEAIESILDARGMSHRRVNSAQLNAMSLEELSKFGVIVWSGGYAGQMSNSLTAATRRKVQRAVRENGVSFVGFCAGAFIAISPDAPSGAAGPAWGFALLNQKTLDYYHLELKGIPDAMVTARMYDGSTRDLLWWGGPFLPDLSGGVIARYSDTGQAAIAQAWAGRGLMILAGPHPEAPQDWRSKLGLSDEDGLDQDIAGNMIEAALTRNPMPSL